MLAAPKRENSPAPIIPPMPRAVAEKRLMPVVCLLPFFNRVGCSGVVNVSVDGG